MLTVFEADSWASARARGTGKEVADRYAVSYLRLVNMGNSWDSTITTFLEKLMPHRLTESLAHVKGISAWLRNITMRYYLINTGYNYKE